VHRFIVAVAHPMGIGPNPVDDPLIPPIQVDENLVTPGVVGFVVTLFVALAVIFLVTDMTRRIRRVRYRGEVRERLEAERLNAEQVGESSTTEGEHPAAN